MNKQIIKKSRQKINTDQYRSSIVEYIRANPNCTLYDIIEVVPLSYKNVYRLLLGYPSAYLGLVKEGMIEAIPALSPSNKLTWRFKIASKKAWAVKKEVKQA